MSRKTITPLRAASAILLACILAFTAASGSAFAASKLVIRNITPDRIEAGQEVSLRFWIQNIGNTETTGPITVVDTFGSQVTKVTTNGGFTGATSSLTPVEVTCPEGTTSVACEINGTLQPGVQVGIDMTATISGQAKGSVTNRIETSGGGAVPVQEERVMEIGPPGPFGFDSAAAELLNADGSSDPLASSIPADYITILDWKSFFSSQNPTGEGSASTEFIKDVVTHLAPGFIGNPSASALCTTAELGQFLNTGEPLVGGATVGQDVPTCPPDSQVGVVRAGIAGKYWTTGLFSMVPPYGYAAELGFNVEGTVVLLQAYVRPGDHGIDVISHNTTTTIAFSDVEVDTWGVPADPSHDIYRGGCVGNAGAGPIGVHCVTKARPQAFLRAPSSCSGAPLAFGAESNSYVDHTMSPIAAPGPTMVGCDMVPFAPSLYVYPTGTATSSPTGVSVKMSLPQSRNPEGLAEGDLKKAVVTLPEGMSINPASADGLQVCTDAQLHMDSNTPAECPDGSKLGTVTLKTQLIPNPIDGSIYIRPQLSNDPMSGEMFRVVFELRDDAHGIDFKIPGHIQANPVTGRLTTTFDDSPQLPFEDISLQFKSGARSALSTPATCTVQTTEAWLYPWARPDEPNKRNTSFQLTSGPNGTPCPGPVLPFHPSLNAGATDVEAGAFTSFLSTFTRSDADQHMQNVSVTMPKGVLGSLVGLPLCPEAQANAGTCDAASQIGTMTAGAGTGPTPYYVTGGKLYMTGSYKGAPYGLSIVVPTKAGPFDLGNVVVRAQVHVDVHTAQLTVTTDPLPQVVGGIPVDLRLVNVTINRPNFVFNPTDCNNSTVTGQITGAQGTTATLSDPFQVTNCAALKFPPRFTVSTNGKTSRAKGASLDATLSYPKMVLGKFVNIAKVKVDLPKRLPSRLTTLQKACLAATFETDPAACPAPSRIGMATATTPVMPVPLSGPVYFVSHGGEAFPDLVVVLQGYGVTIDLVGTTFISKTGITSTTFKTIPDVPVGTFELKMPQGPYSALAANGNLCNTKLTMPTAFIGQDGQEIHTNTPITATGCTKKAKAHHNKNHQHKKGKKK